MKSPFSKPNLALVGAAAFCAGLAAPASAFEFRSIEAAGVFYDAPSQKGKKLFVVRRLTPVEVVVSLEGWAKVRDAEGTLAWVDRKLLSERRTVIVTADRAEVRQAADAGAALVFEAEKGVALDVVDPVKDGWAKVRHVEGQAGFVRATQVWGL